MFDFARPEDVDALKDLWLSCFGGPREYVDFYYSRRFLPEDTLVWREGGRPVSMMTLMRVRQAGEDGAYVYAVATSPEYRGLGLDDPAGRLVPGGAGAAGCQVFRPGPRRAGAVPHVSGAGLPGGVPRLGPGGPEGG